MSSPPCKELDARTVLLREKAASRAALRTRSDLDGPSIEKELAGLTSPNSRNAATASFMLLLARWELELGLRLRSGGDAKSSLIPSSLKISPTRQSLNFSGAPFTYRLVWFAKL